MTTTFFTSDTHFGHKNIISFCDRPFQNVDRMDRALIDNWNALVSPEDIVYHLGDACMGNISYTLPLINELNGYKILVPGNHDRVFSGESAAKRERFMPLYLDVFDEVTDELIDLGYALACHFPYLGDSHDGDRFASQRPTDEGRPILHGHVHEKWILNERQINVGVDVWDCHPVSLDILIPLLEAIK